MQKKQMDVRLLVACGLFTALVFLFSWVQIPIANISRIHLGNVFCALSGLLFGPIIGGISSGLGSMLFDFTNPAYIAESWITFLTKFAIGFLAGILTKGKPYYMVRDFLASTAGCVAYVILYLTKSLIMMYFVEGQAWQAVQTQLITKGTTSLINAVGAIICATLLAKAMRPVLQNIKLIPQTIE